ncbi:MAG: cytochrome c peroxidase [Thermodesulfobacteriota bacterium]|nr:cytochrome c peroxidase [Thermodesulfobacteriota bacterium]
MKLKLFGVSLLAVTTLATFGIAQAEPLGLPPVPIPANNPQTPEKIKLGDKLFHDERFSTTGEVSCATCHEREKAFTDTPLSVSVGINNLTGTRNAPTVINSAYLHSQFWDGREPDLEGQSGQPFINPVEMGLKDHQPILNIVRTDPDYQQQFKNVFGKSGEEITMEEVKMAIASFERTIISGDSPFDRYLYGGDTSAMNENAIRGLAVFVGQGRCVSCHTISETHSIFTDNRFHNLGVSFDLIDKDVKVMADEFSQAKKKGKDVDIAVLENKNISELGRFAVTDHYQDMGAFRTPTLRNVAVTSPYMHDGSQDSLEEVIEFYNNGGSINEGDPVNPFQSGGIRPLNLSEEQKDDLLAFLQALTSPEHQE